jgi:hypothetical protein
VLQSIQTRVQPCFIQPLPHWWTIKMSVFVVYKKGASLGLPICIHKWVFLKHECRNKFKAIPILFSMVTAMFSFWGLCLPLSHQQRRERSSLWLASI